MNPETALAPAGSVIEEIDANSSLDEIAHAVGMLNAVHEWHKAFKARLWTAIEAYVRAHGEFVIGETRYRLGTETDTKVRDLRQAVEEMLGVLDWDSFVACLSSNALKPGECRKALPPEMFQRLFSVEAKTVLVDGKPLKGQKSLIVTDERFTGKIR